MAKPYAQQAVCLAITDPEWFRNLSACASGGVIDEVNFLGAQGAEPAQEAPRGEPVFFKLKSPFNAVAGYGFFASWAIPTIREAWLIFGYKNGDPTEHAFYQRFANMRQKPLRELDVDVETVGSMVLREAHFWAQEQWLPWGTEMGWHPSIQRSATETDQARVRLLFDRVGADALSPPLDFADSFLPVAMDERPLIARDVAAREGQGSFRLRLLEAYSGRCAITGEHTALVLDAAHIQPYLGPRSNHIQNGILLTKEFHVLFDRGYVAVTPDHRVKVSPRLALDWGNGKRYREFDGKPLAQLPGRTQERPSQAALAWHCRERFKAA